jgi:hypothetical protein
VTAVYLSGPTRRFTHAEFHQRLDLGAVVVVQNAVAAFSPAAVTGTFTFDGVELIGSAADGLLARNLTGTRLLITQ